MSRRERLGLGRLQPPRLRVVPAGAQQRIGHAVFDVIAEGDPPRSGWPPLIAGRLTCPRWPGSGVAPRILPSAAAALNSNPIILDRPASRVFRE
jgi:hypothetical protein